MQLLKNKFSDRLFKSFLGEFTLQAFLNRRLDLSQAEIIGRFISAVCCCSRLGIGWDTGMHSLLSFTLLIEL